MIHFKLPRGNVIDKLRGKGVLVLTAYSTDVKKE